MDSFRVEILLQFWLLQEWMRLNLVDGGDDFGCLEKFIKAAYIEIGNTNGPNFACV